MKIYTIGGRKWRAIEVCTMRHDLYMARLTREGGLDQLRLGEGEEHKAFALRSLTALLSSDKMFDLLGGLLIPEAITDHQWTLAISAESAEFFAGLSSDEDKAAEQEAMKPLLIAFFVAGMGYSAPSAAVLEAALAHPATGPEQGPGPKPNLSATSGTGEKSSASWWARIFGSRTKFSTGRSAIV